VQDDPTVILDTNNIAAIESFLTKMLALKHNTDDVGQKFWDLIGTIPSAGQHAHGKGHIKGEFLRYLVQRSRDPSLMESITDRVGKPKAFSTLLTKEKIEFEASMKTAMTSDTHGSKLKTLLRDILIKRMEDVKKAEAASTLTDTADTNPSNVMNKGNISTCYVLCIFMY